MVDFNSVLKDAQQLSDEDRVRLIDALWKSVPADADIPLADEWSAELEQRVTEIRADPTRTVAWEAIRNEALNRIGNGNRN